MPQRANTYGANKDAQSVEQKGKVAKELCTKISLFAWSTRVSSAKLKLLYANFTQNAGLPLPKQASCIQSAQNIRLCGEVTAWAAES
ncbi:MAG: hypothetical protein WC966_05160 [Bradymonadales bacterium]